MDLNKKLEWTTLEYEEKKKDNDWFWALGIIIVASATTSFIYGNYFFGLFLIIGGILLALFAVKKPDLVFYELNEKNIVRKSAVRFGFICSPCNDCKISAESLCC